jgi:Putative transposase
MVRPPMAVGVVQETEEGRVRVQTPVDPRTGERGVELDPLEWIHALGRQVPDPRQHLVRYYGLYANRSRSKWRGRWHGVGSWSGSGEGSPSPATQGEAPRPGSRAGSWARLLRRILEVDPLLCPRCGVRMQVISVITEPRVVDRILAHVKRGDRNPFGERSPPGGMGRWRATSRGRCGAALDLAQDGEPRLAASRARYNPRRINEKTRREPDHQAFLDGLDWEEETTETEEAAPTLAA